MVSYLRSFEGPFHIAAIFDDDEQATIFLPASGDVLISSAESVINENNGGAAVCEAAEMLRELLSQLGVDMC